MREDTTTNSTSPSVAKSNGKWASKNASTHAEKSMTSDVADQAQGLQEKVMDGAKQAYDSIVKNVPSSISGLGTRATGFVKQYPVQAALGGLAIGFLLGAAISRKGE